LRGRNPLVLIDGIPQTTNGSSFFGRELRTIDPAAVERIEVVRGPSAVYGQGGTGGVINIITRRADEDAVTGTLAAGVSAALGDLPGESFGNYFEVGASVNEEPYDAVFNFLREDTGADFDAEGDRIPTVQGTSESETYNVYGRLGWDLNERERLQFTANHYDTTRDTDAISDPIIDDIPGLQKPRALIFDDGIEYIGASPQIDRNTLVSLSYTNDDLWGSQLQGQLYYRDNEVQSDPRDRRSRNQGIFQARLELENWGTRLQVDSPLADSLSLLWGLDYSQEETNSTRNLFDGEVFDASGGRIYQKIDEVLVIPPYTLDSLGLFAQAQWDVSDRVALQGGLRYERFDVSVGDYTTLFGDEIEASSGNFDDVVFNLGGLYRVTDDLSVFASFAQGYSVPSFADALFFPSAGFQLDQNIRDLEPQKVNNYEVGLRGEWDTVQASLAAFYNDSELGSAFIDLDEDNFYEIERAPRRVYGVEATVDWQPAPTWLLGSTLSWAEGDADFEDDGEGFQPLSGFDISPLKATLYIENQTTPGWRNRLQLLLVGSRDRAFDAGIDTVPISRLCRPRLYRQHSTRPWRSANRHSQSARQPVLQRLRSALPLRGFW
jgi:iron complex outermembrane receptor protein